MTPLAELSPVSLERLDAVAPLRTREDRKHVVDLETLDALLRGLAGSHAVLEIDGRRTFTYDSIYLDTPDLLTARAHVQRRRHRFKCRTRLYVDAGTCALEIKAKDGRGATVKHRLPYDPADHGRLTDAGRAFVGEHLDVVPDLVPVLHTTYARTTLLGPTERVTIDSDLSFGSARLADGWVIVETKSARGSGLADRELRGLGSRPVSLSKYVVGAGLVRMDAPPNDVRRLIRRYFVDA